MLLRQVRGWRQKAHHHLRELGVQLEQHGSQKGASSTTLDVPAWQPCGDLDLKSRGNKTDLELAAAGASATQQDKAKRTCHLMAPQALGARSGSFFCRVDPSAVSAAPAPRSAPLSPLRGLCRGELPAKHFAACLRHRLLVEPKTGRVRQPAERPQHHSQAQHHKIIARGPGPHGPQCQLLAHDDGDVLLQERLVGCGLSGATAASKVEPSASCSVVKRKSSRRRLAPSSCMRSMTWPGRQKLENRSVGVSWPQLAGPVPPSPQNLI